MAKVIEVRIKSLTITKLTNAWDSHVAAGTTRPIEVSTPNNLTYYLKVKDYGLGMDADDIRNIYSRYGSSTKRNTNEQTGMLGLGCKSALTYTNQFNIVAVKNNVKINVMVSRGEDGSGFMEIINEVIVDEPNSVEIIIPTKRTDDVYRKALSFFRFWEPGRVLLNDKDPSFVKPESKIGNFYIIEGLDEDYVVMGNVAYPVGIGISGRSKYSREKAVAYVDMGEVHFVPSREQLHMTKKTEKKLHELRAAFNIDMTRHVEQMISTAKDYREAFKLRFKYTNGDTLYSSYTNGIKYKGLDFPYTFDFDYEVHKNYNDDLTCTEASITNASYVMDSVIVYGYEHEKVHTTHKKKSWRWLEENTQDIKRFYLTKDKPVNVWLSSVPMVDWATVKKIKLDPIIRAPKVAKPDLYTFLTGPGKNLYSYNNDLDPKKEIVYCSSAEIVDDSKQALALVLKNNWQFPMINKNQWKSFKVKFPNAIHYIDVVQDMVDKYLAGKIQEDLDYLKQNTAEVAVLGRLDPLEINDPELVKRIVQYGQAVESMRDVTNRYDMYCNVAIRLLNVQDFPRRQYYTRTEDSYLFENYPLLRGWSNYDSQTVQHATVYVNSIYNGKVKK